MTERDFQAEQWYFLSRSWLHQRALHGWGILCGLDVASHPDPNCAAKGWVVVTAGLAIDCYGRTIVLEKDTPVNLQEIPQVENDSDSDTRPTPQGRFLIGIRYKEECIESVPVLYDDHGCGHREAHNRIQETADFVWRNVNGCWGFPKSEDPCERQKPEPCLNPRCPCGAMVALALVKELSTKDSLPEAQDQFKEWNVTGRLSFGGRRYLDGPLSPHSLTHICHLSWTHGGCVHLTNLSSPRQAPSARVATAAPGPALTHGHENGLSFQVTFDCPLKLKPGSQDEAEGLDKNTFVIEYLTDNGIRKTLPTHSVKVQTTQSVKRNDPSRPNCQRGQSTATAILKADNCIVEDFLKAAKCHPVTVYVTLKCDFILDYRERAVDGNFLRAHLPTGDGVEGGTFESWFTLDGKDACGGT